MPKSILGWFWRYCTHADSFISLVLLAFPLWRVPIRAHFLKAHLPVWIGQQAALCITEMRCSWEFTGNKKLKCLSAVE